MRLFRLRGGIHPEARKERSRDSAIVAMPLPAALYIPLRQHIGEAAELVVAEGQQVGKGELVARSQGSVSAAQHAPTSGRIRAITHVVAPHASGLLQTTIVLEPDGEDAWAPLPAPIADPLSAPPEVLTARVAACGIVGLGGAAFPSAVKLDQGLAYAPDILLVNGAECEPYLTCDDRIMREHAAEVIDGARIMAHTIGAREIIVAIERNKPQALAAIGAAARRIAGLRVVALPARYPMGSAQHLVRCVTGRETPADRRTAETGVVVHNVATARAVHEAVRLGRPLIARVVTVSGGAIRTPRNVCAPIGARIADLVAFCGGYAEAPRRVINGGPLMGHPLPSLDAPVVKGTSGILALVAHEVSERPANPCIRCGSCVSVCPSGLVPAEMAALIRKDDLEGAARLGVKDCIACGSCAWVCPSHIQLVRYFSYAKGALAAQAREQRQNEQTRRLAEARLARLKRQAQAKRAAAEAGRAAQTDEAAA